MEQNSVEESVTDELTHIDVETVDEFVSRGEGEGYQLSVWVTNHSESSLVTYSRTEGAYTFAEEDYSDILEALDHIFQTAWERYSSSNSVAPHRCPEDAYEVVVTVTDAEECEPPESTFDSSHRFSVQLNEDTELIEDVDRLFDSLS
ncbi:hypothetical protein JMJ58_03650 [Haloterrigena salifodinae]|uniref:Uncharacterized protein n=1 Tax=Haloterrigena salifodinae TaxID=2675099 RepID=A0A8T8E374_9EURY|nr:hypothetical protein [Haloterrigena salifodinae]QRV16003.1 hypothetical protein JMJ58_03650 [Haloterrigena salifodinae]